MCAAKDKAADCPYSNALLHSGLDPFVILLVSDNSVSYLDVWLDETRPENIFQRLLQVQFLHLDTVEFFIDEKGVVRYDVFEQLIEI